MCSQYLCNIAYTAALLTHSLYGLPVLVMQTLVLSFRHVLCSFPSSFAFYGKKNKRVRVFTLCTLFFSAVSYKKENRQRLYNLLSIFILKLIAKIFFHISVHKKTLYRSGEFLKYTAFLISSFMRYYFVLYIAS